MPLHRFLSLLAAIAALCCAGADPDDCAFTMGTRLDDPLLLWPDGGLVYPDVTGTVRAEQGAEIVIACPGEGNNIVLKNSGSRRGAAGGSTTDHDGAEGKANGGGSGEEGVGGAGSGKTSDEHAVIGKGIGGGVNGHSGDEKETKEDESTREIINDGNEEGAAAYRDAERTRQRRKTEDNGESITKDGDNRDVSGEDAGDGKNVWRDGKRENSGNRNRRAAKDIPIMGINTTGNSNGGRNCKNDEYNCREGGNDSVGREEGQIEISGSELKVVCVVGRNFSIGQQIVNITNLKCRESPMHSFKTTVATTPSCGGPRVADLFQVGFATSLGFLEVTEMCFDGNTLTPVYTKHFVPREIQGRQSFKGRTWFRVGPQLRGTNPSKYYKDQKESLKSLNVSEIPGQFLNRGHCSPRADFVQIPQQRATYIYENTAPQWASFNAGDWEKLEKSVRNLAVVRRNLTVITGTYGTATLKNTNNEDVYIHLSRGAGRKTMTVPAVFWKVVFDPDSSESIAVLGANRPRDYEVSLPPLPCEENLCSQVEWLSRRGQLHCCTVEDVRQRLQLPVLQDLPALQPLTTFTSLMKSQSSEKYSGNFRARA